MLIVVFSETTRNEWIWCQAAHEARFFADWSECLVDGSGLHGYLKLNNKEKNVA